MAEIIWTPQAISDLEVIRAFISRDSEHYGALVVRRVIESVTRLQAYPASGRVVPERGVEELRELLWGNYRIVYKMAEDRVHVLTVFHGARTPRLP
ncbi:MAG: type II toxin-antitoxin system RelE/ParE family toxin [Planctomycetota bacterium]|nr:type II toxin-antitoxin system RelE/ParE family toxin [Planctomycetota bacterium]